MTHHDVAVMICMMSFITEDEKVSMLFSVGQCHVVPVVSCHARHYSQEDMCIIGKEEEEGIICFSCISLGSRPSKI